MGKKAASAAPIMNLNAFKVPGLFTLYVNKVKIDQTTSHPNNT